MFRTPPTTTASPFATGCDGVATFDFNGYIASGVNPSLVAGASVWLQAISRDPGFAAPSNSGLSAALEIVVGP